MFKKLSFVFIAVIILITFIGCVKKDDKLTISVTILPQKAFAEAVVKNLANVEVLVPSGASPETYEPTQRQMESINNSSLFIKIGVPIENSNLIKSIDKVKIIDSSKKVSESYADEEFSKDNRDPHIWLSIKRVIIMVQQIADEMSIIDPDNSSSYQANAAEYILKLNALNTEIIGYFANKTNKFFMTFHPAYGYLAAEYGLTMFALEEEGKETTIARKQLFIDTAKDNNISVIFSQAEFDKNQDSWVSSDIGATVTKLNPLSSDYINNYRDMAQKISASMN